MSSSMFHGGGWCEALYEAQASALLLYGRALGLSHSEAEDVLHETFIALLERPQAPQEPAHYAVRAFRNRALNHRRSLMRRVWRELESQRWFEPSSAETAAERFCHVRTDPPAGRTTRDDCPENLE
jgi:DNA-directed RNA polymerase specialized sigma24 family protein